MRSKHVVEHFKGDPWPVRMAVVIMHWTFRLALVGLLTGTAVQWPLLSLLLKRVI
jgi:hypothetical protein